AINNRKNQSEGIKIKAFFCNMNPLIVISALMLIGLASAWSNNYDRQLYFECPDNESINNIKCQNGAGVVTGMKSDHDNHHEDRRWKIKCCKPRSTCYSECKLTPYVNEYDRPLSYSVETGYYLTGMESVHDNHHEYTQIKPCHQVRSYLEIPLL
ncbi:hypothetical protein TCAL_11991, partial [Tigriopus californicus]